MNILWVVIAVEAFVIAVFFIHWWWQRYVKKMSGAVALAFSLADKQFAEAAKAFFGGDIGICRLKIANLLRSLGNGVEKFRAERPLLGVFISVLPALSLYEEAAVQYAKGEFIDAMRLYTEADKLTGRLTQQGQITWPGQEVFCTTVFVQGTREFCWVPLQNIQYYDWEHIQELVDRLWRIRKYAEAVGIVLPVEHARLWREAYVGRIDGYFQNVRDKFAKGRHTVVFLSDILVEIGCIRRDAEENSVSLPAEFDCLEADVVRALELKKKAVAGQLYA